MYNMTGDAKMIPILYRDDTLVICEKPVGVSSEKDGMPALLRARLGGEVFPVHRLDTAVGGLMVYARTPLAAASLSEQIRTRSFEKEYLAVVQGCVEPPQGAWEDLLFHDRGRNKSYVVRRRRAGVREAKLDYRVIETREGFSLLRIRLHTGRTHQIRVQAASRAHPLVGDLKYGSAVRDCPIALWSHALRFALPSTGETRRFEALPECRRPWDLFQDCLYGGFPCDTSK